MALPALVPSHDLLCLWRGWSRSWAVAEIRHEIPGGSSLPSGAWTTSAWPPHLHPRGMPGWPPRVYRTKEQQVSGHHPLPPQTGAQRKLADGARTQPGKRLRPSREGCPAVPLGAHTTPHKGGSRHRRTCGAGAPETERGRAGVLCGHRTRPHAGGSVRPAGEGNAEPASARSADGDRMPRSRSGAS